MVTASTPPDSEWPVVEVRLPVSQRRSWSSTAPDHAALRRSGTPCGKPRRLATPAAHEAAQPHSAHTGPQPARRAGRRSHASAEQSVDLSADLSADLPADLAADLIAGEPPERRNAPQHRIPGPAQQPPPPARHLPTTHRLHLASPDGRRDALRPSPQRRPPLRSGWLVVCDLLGLPRRSSGGSKPFYNPVRRHPAPGYRAPCNSKPSPDLPHRRHDEQTELSQKFRTAHEPHEGGAPT